MGYTGSNCSTPLCFGDTSCPNNGKCVSPNTCRCPTGYASPNCSDIDECIQNTDQCEQNCVNIQGSYKCSCRTGYSLDRNGLTCNDLDECTIETDKCEQNCLNTPGSYDCFCDQGYSLDKNAISCNDNTGRSLVFSLLIEIESENYDIANISADVGNSETLKNLVTKILIYSGTFQKFPEIIVREMRIIPYSMSEIRASVIIVFSKKDDAKDPAFFKHGLSKLLHWQSVTYDGITARAKLDIPENISTVCEIYTFLVGQCEDGFQCTSNNEGPMCSRAEPPVDRGLKVKLIIYIMPVLALASALVIVMVIVYLKKRGNKVTSWLVKYRKKGPGVAVENITYDNNQLEKEEHTRTKKVVKPSGPVDTEEEPEGMYCALKEGAVQGADYMKNPTKSSSPLNTGKEPEHVYSKVEEEPIQGSDCMKNPEKYYSPLETGEDPEDVYCEIEKGPVQGSDCGKNAVNSSSPLDTGEEPDGVYSEI